MRFWYNIQNGAVAQTNRADLLSPWKEITEAEYEVAYRNNYFLAIGWK